jgi:hypothetical protein
MPSTAEELWEAVRRRVEEQFAEERNDFVPGTSRQRKGKGMHSKIPWRLAQLMALIALVRR